VVHESAAGAGDRPRACRRRRCADGEVGARCRKSDTPGTPGPARQHGSALREHPAPRQHAQGLCPGLEVWQDYTTDLGIPLLSGTVGALTGFVVWLERGRLLRPAERADPAVDERADPAAPATIERSLIGAIAGLRDHHVHIGPDTSRAAWQALKGYRQRLAQAGATRGRGKAAMVTLPDLRSIVVAGMSRYRYLKCE
jgi:hypothetical protein